ncbi:hypothetical protein HED60_05650 [Planctomycetales bacterium ZRK34]|nr:hypothetical protein HED60_05650 [Planctomycetales bacterium ZRK34]
MLARLPPSVIPNYAIMANDNPRVLQLIHEMSVSMYAGSAGHLDLLHTLGLDSPSVIFAPSAFSPSSCRVASEIADLIVFANSPRQYALIREHAPKARIGVRVRAPYLSPPLNGYSDKHYLAASPRIGMPRSRVLEWASHPAGHAANIYGLHLYPGTNITSLDLLFGVDGRPGVYDEVFSIAERLPSIKVLDLGGGMPSTFHYPFDCPLWQDWSRQLSERIERFRREHRSIDVLFEFGRAIVAESGLFVTTVLDIVEDEQTPTLVCDASMSMFPRPYIYESASKDHPVCVINSDRSGPAKRYVIAGSTTFSGDLLHTGALLSEVTVGDRLAFHNAGAYCASMSSRFLGCMRPAEYLLTQDGLLLDASIRGRHNV